MKTKIYFVTWEETHVYQYFAYVKAASVREAKKIASSSSDVDERRGYGMFERCGEFDRVKGVGRKRVRGIADEEKGGGDVESK